MLKKSIIGLLLLAIAMPAFAGGDVEKKVEANTWPVVYKWLPICEDIKVVMNVGYYVKIEKCKEMKLKLAQKNIGDYEGCIDFNIMTNFDLELGARITPTSAGLALQSNTGKWKAWIKGEHFLAPTTSYKKRTVCARVDDASIVKADPNKELLVAKVTILVKPTATP